MSTRDEAARLPDAMSVARAGEQASWSGTLREWRRRLRYRRDLRRLSRSGSHLIDDIGLTLEEARREMRKPFWEE
jgi:uncharacterized protein YjiS (DUF1127 family)